MRIPMTDLRAQYSSLKEEIDSAIGRVIESGRFILGPEVESFETEMAAFCRAKFAIGVGSGTDALVLALKAGGVAPGDEVITTPFSFIATAMSIIHCGALPVFVDIDPTTYNIDPRQIEARISAKTKAIVPAHLFGQAADMESIMDIARDYKLKVIEDAAQALSAEYNGQKVGSIGDAGCLSFFPAKNLGAFGDGGMVITNNPQIADTVKMLRNHGSKISYYHVLPGFNSRLDAMQAAILRVKLRHLENWSSLRRQKAALYSDLLGQVEGIETPNVSGRNTISANYYTVRLLNHGPDRGELRSYLASKGIETNIYYPLSLHLQEAFRHLGYHPGDFPHSELAQQQVISFPIYPEIRDEDIAEVVDCVKEFSQHNSRGVLSKAN
ncbi:MAG: DegT/DnrJ/EryC1/StrS family aminotransferase [Dehalococcoidales bacterium]|nr:DegT/DnrJ/EryC1/StrS family aminotransferase [Dehalococcoidales bacterium]